MKKCYCCGSTVEPDFAKFCSKCGKPFEITADLINQALAQNQLALTELYQRTYNTVYASIRTKVSDEEIICDLIQDTYLRAFTHIDQLKNAESFPGCLLVIARNTTINWYKRHAKENKVITISQLSYQGEDDFSNEDDALQIPEFRTECIPDESLDRNETGRLLDELLSELPAIYRLPLSMRYFENMSIREIADTLEVNENTVKTRLTKGKKLLEAKVLDLEKKGTKIYNLAPLSFLLFLLRNMAATTPAISTSQAQAAVDDILSSMATEGIQSQASRLHELVQDTGNTAPLSQSTATVTAAKTAGVAISKATAIKIVVAALIVAIAGGVAIGSRHLSQSNAEEFAAETIESIVSENVQEEEIQESESDVTPAIYTESITEEPRAEEDVEEEEVEEEILENDDIEALLLAQLEVLKAEVGIVNPFQSGVMIYGIGDWMDYNGLVSITIADYDGDGISEMLTYATTLDNDNYNITMEMWEVNAGRVVLADSVVVYSGSRTDYPQGVYLCANAIQTEDNCYIVLETQMDEAPMSSGWAFCLFLFQYQNDMFQTVGRYESDSSYGTFIDGTYYEDGVATETVRYYGCWPDENVDPLYEDFDEATAAYFARFGIAMDTSGSTYYQSMLAKENNNTFIFQWETYYADRDNDNVLISINDIYTGIDFEFVLQRGNDLLGSGDSATTTDSAEEVDNSFAAANWKTLYANYLSTCGFDFQYGSFCLVNVNQDAVPELLYCKGVGYENSYLFYIQGSTVEYYETYAEEFLIRENSGYIDASWGQMGECETVILYLDSQNQLSVVFNGTYNMGFDFDTLEDLYLNCTINGVSVTSDVFTAQLESATEDLTGGVYYYTEADGEYYSLSALLAYLSS